MKFLLFLLTISQIIFAQTNELSWPREIDDGNYLTTIYQPQIEKFDKINLEGRMAISIKPKGQEIVFCSAWFKSKVLTDLDSRTVELESFKVEKIHFPSMDDSAKINKFKEALEKEINNWNVVMSLDRLLASLNDEDFNNASSVQVENSPPDIYFRTSPHTLITIDGEPILKSIDNSNLEYVVNTPFFLVREESASNYFLRGGKFWYTSNKITEGWKETTSIPKAIKELADKNKQELDSISASIKVAPSLIVVTKPSELIVTDGEPDYQAIKNTSLLYVKNSESDIIMDVNSQNHYILIAGRWYHSKTLKDADWKFTAPEDLPKDFKNIPENSAMASVRISIPGTDEAKEALLEQSIPQTATVDRKTASVEVKFDGNPEFKKIENSKVAYAVNSDKTVLKIENKYYAVDDGIWFVANKAAGPYKVSDVRPDEVDDIPPSSEVYNVKYVYVFDSTPDVVYVGYYPGYCHSYVYHGVVVYGTGYRYHPWYRHYYYPRPVTYGFGVHYNPYTGWGFHISFRYGWVGWGFHPYYRPYWGPRGYHYGYRHGYNHGFRHGYRAGYRAGQIASRPRPTPYNNRNVYRNRKTGIAKTRDLKDRRPSKNINARPSTRPNNVYSDRKGNIHQRDKNGNWSQKYNNKQNNNKSVRPSTRDNKINKIDRSANRKQLERSYNNRTRGNNSYNRSRSGSSNRSVQRRSRR